MTQKVCQPASHISDLVSEILQNAFFVSFYGIIYKAIM